MPDQAKSKILLIDDDTSLLVTLSDFLAFEGYDVTTADSGEAGLKRLEVMTPDLIILDMSMPGMGGIGFLKHISSPDGEPAHPVLVLTARANMAEFFADVKVEGFVAKPCNPEDLLMEVSRIIFLRKGVKVGGETVAAVQKKVLIGEDDAGTAHTVDRAFGAAGYLTSTVSKGPDVLERAIVERPDVILMKLVLANMNGDAVAATLHQLPNTSGIPIVIYDDSDAAIPESKLLDAGTGIRKFVRNNNVVDLLAAVASVLAG